MIKKLNKTILLVIVLLEKLLTKFLADLFGKVTTIKYYISICFFYTLCNLRTLGSFQSSTMLVWEWVAGTIAKSTDVANVTFIRLSYDDVAASSCTHT